MLTCLAAFKGHEQVERLPAAEYNVGTYLGYLFYPPLYIAGPIMTFDSYATQLRTRSYPGTRNTLLYLVRLLVAMFILEAITHTLYFNGMAQQRVWKRWPASSHLAFSASDMGIAGFWVLNFMWLKVLSCWFVVLRPSKCISATSRRVF